MSKQATIETRGALEDSARKRKRNTIERFNIDTTDGFDRACDQAEAYIARNPSARGIKTLGQRDMLKRRDVTTVNLHGKTVHKAQRAKVK